MAWIERGGWNAGDNWDFGFACRCCGVDYPQYVEKEKIGDMLLRFRLRRLWDVWHLPWEKITARRL